VPQSGAQLVVSSEPLPLPAEDIISDSSRQWPGSVGRVSIDGVEATDVKSPRLSSAWSAHRLLMTFSTYKKGSRWGEEAAWRPGWELGRSM
jgi:hypothetical protein